MADDWEISDVPPPLPPHKTEWQDLPKDVQDYIMSLVDDMRQEKRCPDYYVGDAALIGRSCCRGVPHWYPTGIPMQGKVFWKRGKPEGVI